MTIAQMTSRWNSIDVVKEASWVVSNNSQKLADLNREQLFKGETRLETDVKPKYRDKYYGVHKQKMNNTPSFMTPDLKYTGAFYDGFYVGVRDGGYFLSSIDSKTDVLAEKYKDIFGLSPYSANEARIKFLQKEFIDKLKAYLFK